MHPSTRICAVLTAIASIVGAPLVADATPFAFANEVDVGPGFGEPSLAVAPDGTLYSTSIVGGTAATEDAVYSSTDMGSTWRRSAFRNPVIGGDDDHVAVAPDGTLFVNGQWFAGACQSVAHLSADGDDIISLQPIVCDRPATDRAWLTVSTQPTLTADYTVYAYFHSPCCGGNHVVMRSDDAGVTWLRAGYPFSYGGFPGNIVVDDAAGRLYATTIGTSFEGPGVEVAVSTDRGVTWARHHVANVLTGDGGLNHVFLAADDAGGLYTAWTDNVDGSGYDIFFSSSSDGGVTWSPRARVADVSGTQVYPTIAAAERGHVVVAWYETAAAGNPNLVPRSATWRPRAARSFDAGSTSPAWTVTDISSTLNHKGPICTRGAACTADRGLLDFFTVQIDHQGHAVVAWASDTGERRVRFARSTAP